MSLLLKSLICSMLIFVSKGPVKAQDLSQDLQYRQLTTPAGQDIHLLQVNPRKFILRPAHAYESAQGLETVASIAKRYKAIAAINGGFFKQGLQMDGLPAGILKIQGKWYGIAYHKRGAIAWCNTVPVTFIDRIQTKTTITIEDKTFPVYAMNQPGLNKKNILYTDAYGQYTDSVADSQNIAILNNQVVELQENSVDKALIPFKGFVYSIGPKSNIFPLKAQIGNLALVKIDVLPEFNPEQQSAWQHADHIMGGAPVLIKNHKIIPYFEQENLQPSFINAPHARTAIGILPNGHWLLVVVPHSLRSQGMTLPELAEFMQAQGCVDALNLDGGNSSSLYIDPKVARHFNSEPQDWFELRNRPISDALLILPYE